MGFADWMRERFLTPDAVYGLILFSVLVAGVSDDDSSAFDVLLFSVLSLVIFWSAHVFAGTVSAHGKQSLGAAMRQSLKHSSGMLYSSILPSLALVAGAFHLISTDNAVDLSLLLAMIVLGLLGYRSFAQRKSPIIVRILGALGTAFFGLLVIILNLLVH